MSTLFFTGFPGLLGSELLPRILARARDATAVCLVQSQYVGVARRRAEELALAERSLRGRIRLIEGDIARPDLGLGDAGDIGSEMDEIYHLAAAYDLSLSLELGQRVNVEGTRNVLDFAARCGALERFHHMSTCYVSGRYAGIFTEEDLDKGQSFNNFYEQTKFLAEVEVRERMEQGLPATIYRPAIVVGDSRTGETQRYNGPYFVMRWLLRQPRIAVMPVVGDATRTRLNVVPRDFVVEALAHLSRIPQSRGKVYHLADPEPLTVDETLKELARATGRRLVRLPLPLRLAKGAIDHVPGVYRLMGIPSAALDYGVHPTYYATTNAQADLEASGIRVPPLPSYVDRLVDFVRRHPEIGSQPML
ncbi:MAG: SDR family oxidoreductase [Gemmatimonadota bacterium]